jgi:large exoprotein involved in heme utilization and adhesion
VKSGKGSGGNILIDPTFVVLNNSQIKADAFGGPGGKVTIIADNLLKSSDSTITASFKLSTPAQSTFKPDRRFKRQSGSIARRHRASDFAASAVLRYAF